MPCQRWPWQKGRHDSVQQRVHEELSVCNKYRLSNCASKFCNRGRSRARNNGCSACLAGKNRLPKIHSPLRRSPLISTRGAMRPMSCASLQCPSAGVHAVSERYKPVVQHESEVHTRQRFTFLRYACSLMTPDRRALDGAWGSELTHLCLALYRCLLMLFESESGSTEGQWTRSWHFHRRYFHPGQYGCRPDVCMAMGPSSYCTWCEVGRR